MIPPAYQRDLILLGGGHTHTLALRMLAMSAPPGLRISLVSEGSFSPYSGMLPGLVAGHYAFEDVHIDLRGLCARLGVRFVQAQASGLDADRKQVIFPQRPPLGYDVLSINIGARPDLQSTPGAAAHAVPVKPVADFYRRWQALLAGAGPAEQVTIVGGGAGSVELALAIAHKLGGHGAGIRLLCGEDLLPGYSRGARRRVRSYLAGAGVETRERHRVTEVEAGRLRVETGEEFAFGSLLWCTAAVAAPWLAQSGLPCDERGFLRLDDTLRLEGSDDIFAAGDTAVQVNHPRPRAGVFAVRQAPVLAQNLLATFRGDNLRNYRPQRRFLSLLSMGTREAVADRGLFHAGGAWVWRWKDHIDRRFMAQFDEPAPRMADSSDPQGRLMHCGGCGAKLPASMLREVLEGLAQKFPAVVDASRLADDGAVLALPGDATLVQSVDTLRSLVDDPWIMGRLAALHALSDLHAMGALPHSCLAQVTLPWGGAGLQQRDLELLLDGAMTEMARVDCALVGGHSLEGPELSIGFTVNGIASGERTLPKSLQRECGELVLAKPLGSGVIFAAQMQDGANAACLDAALENMLRGNLLAAQVAREYRVSACTDVTGFGLLGHVLEMTGTDRGIQAALRLSGVPLLDGVEALFRAGYESTLQPGNREAVASAMTVEKGCDRHRLEALFDPQTCGGLLFAVPAGEGARLAEALVSAGYPGATVIGGYGPCEPGQPPLRVSP